MVIFRRDMLVYGRVILQYLLYKLCMYRNISEQAPFAFLDPPPMDD